MKFDRIRYARRLAALAALGLFVLLGGCQSATSVAFTNVSDSWLNVSVYSGYSATPGATPENMVSDGRLQISPGETVNYRLSSHPGFVPAGNNLVHLQVQPVTPSWEPNGADYWLELLTTPPVTIVAGGSSQNLTFMTGEGAVAIIPDSTLQEGRFQHHTATAMDPGPAQ